MHSLYTYMRQLWPEPPASPLCGIRNQWSFCLTYWSVTSSRCRHSPLVQDGLPMPSKCFLASVSLGQNLSSLPREGLVMSFHPLRQKGQQTFALKGQTVNIFRFAGHIWSVTHTCFCSCCVCLYNPSKLCKPFSALEPYWNRPQARPAYGP